MSLRRKNNDLQGEIDHLHELMNQVPQTLEAGNRSASRHQHRSVETTEPVTGDEAIGVFSQQGVSQAKKDTLPSTLESFDLDALSTNNLKLQAQPWTTVAGDGLVSELLSSFFAQDNWFYLSFVDQGSFLHDMQADDIGKAGFCSPLLVNAMCALRCVSVIQYAISMLLTSPLADLNQCQSFRLIARFRRPGMLPCRSQAFSGARVWQKNTNDGPGADNYVRLLCRPRQRQRGDTIPVDGIRHAG
jgi:hypothetical protein